MKKSQSVVPSTPVTVRYRNDSLYRVEDSGYHTFSPTGIERYDETSNCPVAYVSIQSSDRPGLTSFFTAKLTRNDGFTTHKETRRGTKRPYEEESQTPTPTREISHKIQKLYVSDNNKMNASYLITSERYEYKENQVPELPTTPVKTCKSNCQVSPFRKGKRLNFNIHSLKCEGLQTSTPKFRRCLVPVTKKSHYRPNVKFNIIKKLIQCKMYPPVLKILQYLSNKDFYNLSLVCSETWVEICDKILHNAEEKRQEYVRYLDSIKENIKNQNSIISKKNTDSIHERSLKEIHNVMNTFVTVKKAEPTSQNLPQQQLRCVLCWQPAEVVEELSGEQWAQCSKLTCSHQFCKLCKCDRHPGKKCIQYDLEGPSPSKRKKVFPKNSIGSKKSKKMLFRLL